MSEPKFLTVEHLSTKDIQRIFSKIVINPVSGCWEWQAKLSHSGTNYGCVWFRGKEERIHRVMYAWLVAPVPIGVAADIPNLDHECNNKKCCNPTHLTLKSHRANVLRSDNPTARNARKTHCPNGHPYQTTTWKQGKKRICQICHNARAVERNRTPDGHNHNLEYHRAHRGKPGNREKYRDAVRRYRERLKASK